MRSSPVRASTVLDARAARRVRHAYATMLPLEDRLEPHLRGVVRDTLAHPGSLARAQLAFRLGMRRGASPRCALGVAVAIEYFHSASLIFDDMPAMDDARRRRGRACAHRVWGEAAATLGALALITRAYDVLWQAIADLPKTRRRRIASLVVSNLGVCGILDGQARDVHFGRRLADETEILRVAAAKTVPLVRLALLIPALATGADRPTLDRLDRLAGSWGIAYQILDDFKDLLLTEREAGKSTARDRGLGRPNLPERAGSARALRRLDGRLAAAQHEVSRLVVGDRVWRPLEQVQTYLEETRAGVAQRLVAEASPA